MISRRALIAGGALALAGSASPARLVQAADKSFLPQGLPEGVYDTAALEALPGKKPLIKLVLSSAELRNAALVFHVGIYAERFLLRPLSPRGYSGRDRPGTMEADGRRRGRGAAA